MYGIILTIDIITAIIIVFLVLLQQGKGANMGVSFGSVASNTVFGSKGASSFLFKMTVFFTGLFFLCCLSLGYIGKRSNSIFSPSINSSYENSISSEYDHYQEEVSKVLGVEDKEKKSKNIDIN